MTRRAVVTDHAVVRYLERVCGVDVEAVRTRIERTAQPGVAVGASAINVGQAKFILRGHVVTTVMHRDWNHGLRHGTPIADDSDGAD